MANLYYVQNTITFFGLTMIKLPQMGDFFCINPYYNKNAEKMRELATIVKTLFPYLVEVRYEKVKEREYEYVLLTSLCDESYETISTLNKKDFIIIEDGAGDYIPHTEPNPFYKNKVYLFQPTLVKHNEIKEKAQVSLDGALSLVKQIYSTNIDELNEFPMYTPCLFTTSLEEDYGVDESIVKEIMNYLHDVMGVTELIISRHPRDHFEYKHDKIRTYTLPNGMAGQLINRMFFGKKIYLFPGTELMSSRNTDVATLLNVLPNNEKYMNNMNSILSSPIFYNRVYKTYVLGK